MKYMTNAQIDELNLLLDKHGAALTAFYNQGAKNVIHGMMIGAAIIAGVQITRAIIRAHKQKN